jgi:hypothetical protein
MAAITETTIPQAPKMSYKLIQHTQKIREYNDNLRYKAKCLCKRNTLFVEQKEPDNFLECLCTIRLRPIPPPMPQTPQLHIITELMKQTNKILEENIILAKQMQILQNEQERLQKILKEKQELHERQRELQNQYIRDNVNKTIHGKIQITSNEQIELAYLDRIREKTPIPPPPPLPPSKPIDKFHRELQEKERESRDRMIWERRNLKRKTQAEELHEKLHEKLQEKEIREQAKKDLKNKTWAEDLNKLLRQRAYYEKDSDYDESYDLNKLLKPRAYYEKDSDYDESYDSDYSDY